MDIMHRGTDTPPEPGTNLHDRARARREAFEAFHAENPHVYVELVKAARVYRQQTGNVKCGMTLLVGRVRWVLSIRTRGDDFELNNNYAPFYARLIMEQEPDLAGMFDLRRSYADEVAA